MSLFALPCELFGTILQFVNGENIIDLIHTSSGMKPFIEEAMKNIRFVVHCNKILVQQSIEWFRLNKVILVLKRGKTNGIWLVGKNLRYAKKMCIISLNGVPVHPWILEKKNGINYLRRQL